MTITLEYKRNQDESLDNYLLRLGDSKDLYELNWNQIADLMNAESSEDFGESKWRKEYHLLKRGFELAVKSKVTEDEYLQEIRDQQLELKKEKYKLQTLRIDENRVIREDARKELLLEEIKASIGRVQSPTFNILPSSRNERGFLLGMADIHLGKIFESVNNKYDENILHTRMEQLLSEVVYLCSHEKIKTLDIVNGGDNIEGMALRISQLMNLQIGMTDMTIRFSRMMVEWLNRLSQYVQIRYHHVLSSNHSELRPLGTKAGQFPKEDMERIIHMYIHDMLQDNSRVQVPEYKSDYARFNICNYLFYAKHGHQIKNVKSAIKDLSMLHREFIDYLVLAHYHHPESIALHEGTTNDCELLMLPSIMGSDKFSDTILTGSKAGAKMFIVEENKGIVNDIRIKLN